MRQFEALAAGIKENDAANRTGPLGARRQKLALAVFSGFLLPGGFKIQVQHVRLGYVAWERTTNS